MTISEVKCRLETWNELADPDAGHGNDERIRVGVISGKLRVGFVFFGMPFPLGIGAVINSATLKLYAAGSNWTGTANLITQRVLETWKQQGPGRLTYNNIPDRDTGGGISTSIGPRSSGQLISVNVTSFISDVADGTADWHGLALIHGGSTRAFFSSDAIDPDLYPTLEVDWDLPIGYTSDLTPSGLRSVEEAPVLRWSGDQANEYRVLMSTSPKLDDSGKLFNVEYDSRWKKGQEHDLKRTQFELKENTTVYWQVALRRDKGPAGKWSELQWFTKIPRGNLTISQPHANTKDSTPLVKHHLTKHSQHSVRYILRHAEKVLYDSERVRTDSEVYVLPEGLIGEEGDYNIEVQVWDDIARYHDKPTIASKDFRYSHADVDPPSSLQFIKTPSPGVKLRWEHLGEPTAFDLMVDGLVVKRVTADEAQLGDGLYQATIRRNELPEEFTASVAAVEGRQSSEPQPLTITNAVMNKWLSTASIDVIMVGDDPQFSIGTDEEVFTIPGRRDPVQVIQTARGYEGTFAGSMPDYPPHSVTADQQRDNFLSIIELRTTTEIRLAWRNIDIPIVLFNVTGPAPHTRADWYDVSFSFSQVGDYTFTP
jgi:hypothetical protein